MCTWQIHALRRGSEAGHWVSNVKYWDPTWFAQETDLIAKLRARAAAKGPAESDRHRHALAPAEEFIESGGRVHWGDLSPARIAGVLGRGLC